MSAYIHTLQSQGKAKLGKGREKKKERSSLSGFNHGDTQPLANYAINEIAKLSSRFERSPWERGLGIIFSGRWISYSLALP